MPFAKGGVRAALQTVRNTRLHAAHIRTFRPRIFINSFNSNIRLISTQSKLGASASAAQASSPQRPSPVHYSSKISIPLNDKQTTTFDSIFLRDACQCSQCIDPSSSQKNFQTSDIPSDIQGVCIGTSNQNGIPIAHIRWTNDIPQSSPQHDSKIPLSLLTQTPNHHQHIPHFTPSTRTFWSASEFSTTNDPISYSAFTTSSSSLHAGLSRLTSHGLLFLSDVPDCSATDSSSSLLSIVNAIGPVRNSFYGLTWDVRSVPQATNVAYTHQFLGLHMDLCYMDLTPQFQFLHSLRARAPGGESLFSDAFRAAQIIREEDKEMWAALLDVDVTFHYYNDGQSYRQARKTVELDDPSDPQSAIKNVNWSPPFQGPFQGVSGRQLRAYVRAARRFEELVSKEENVFEYRMKEGECVIFDNRRVLHARRAFDISKGERWLKGAYLDRDVFASKAARLSEVYG